jgi:hypothetical protein
MPIVVDIFAAIGVLFVIGVLLLIPCSIKAARLG